MSGSGQTLRIIGGQWRRRRLRFPAVPGLRPTGDRIRETVFNWLQNEIPGAHCLDLFAGSGAMGLEAASRGAARVVMVERSRTAYRSLLAHQALLDAAMLEIVHDDARRFLRRPPQRFDVVFLDPPFQSDIIGTCCKLLEEEGWLASNATIYLELDKATPLPSLPTTWDIVREKVAGQVTFRIARRRASEE